MQTNVFVWTGVQTCALPICTKILFENLTPLHANERFRMERGNGSKEDITARVLDLASPIGRGAIVNFFIVLLRSISNILFIIDPLIIKGDLPS